MPQVTIHSNKFPGIQLNCPQIPGDENRAGGFLFPAGKTVTVTPETLAALQIQFNRMPETVSRHLRLDAIAENQVSVGIANPVTEEPEPEPEPTEEPEPFVLSEEDAELIETEVAKLEGKTIAEAQPLLMNMAYSEGIPVELRRQYLEAVRDRESLKKSLQQQAVKILSEL